MDDSLQKAMQDADARSQQVAQRQSGILAGAQARAEDLARQAAEALKTALSGYEKMSQPVVNIVSTPTLAERKVAAEISGPGLTITAHVTVGWAPGDGINIGHGRSSDIDVEVCRGFTKRETFKIPIDSGGPVFSGRFSIDRDVMKKGIVAAISSMPS